MTMKFWDDEKSITLTRCVVVAALIGSIAMTLGGAVGDGVVHCSGRAAP